jgi:hypothetical protein
LALNACPEAAPNSNTFREVCIGATCRSLGPKRVDGWDGSKAKDDFLSVLAYRREKRLARWSVN